MHSKYDFCANKSYANPDICQPFKIQWESKNYSLIQDSYYRFEAQLQPVTQIFYENKLLPRCRNPYFDESFYKRSPKATPTTYQYIVYASAWAGSLTFGSLSSSWMPSRIYRPTKEPELMNHRISKNYEHISNIDEFKLIKELQLQMVPGITC